MVTRIAKFKKLTCREQMLFLEALVLHLWTGLLLKIIPFKWIPGIFTNSQGTGLRAQTEVIEVIRDAIGRASGVSLWRNRCLVSSLAGRCVLRRRKIPSQLSLGVAKDTGGNTVAHAWLRAGDIEIVPAGGSFQVLYQF